MKTKNTCLTYFYMTGEFDPDEVTALLEITPEEKKHSGEIGSNGVVQRAYWKCGTRNTYDWNVDRLMKETISLLQSKVNLLQEIKQKNKVDFYLEVVPVLCVKEITPCLAPSIEVMKFCCETSTNLDIDLYLEK